MIMAIIISSATITPTTTPTVLPPLSSDDEMWTVMRLSHVHILNDKL